MAETPDQKRRGENLNRLTEQFAKQNNEAMMNLVAKVEEQTKKQDDANKQRIADGNLTAKEIADLKKVIETGMIGDQEASQEVKESAQRQIDNAERGTTALLQSLQANAESFDETAKSNEKSRLDQRKFTQAELVTLREIADGSKALDDREKASAQLTLKAYEEDQKKIGIFEKIARRSVEGLDNLAAPEGETAEQKEKRLADEKVFGKIKDGVMKTGIAFDKFAGEYGKRAKEGGLALLKGFAIGIIIISLMKFLKSPKFQELLDVIQGFFGFIDTLVEQFGLATTLTLGLVALFKPSLFMIPLKLAIGLLKGGYKFLTDETVRNAADVKMTKAFTKLGDGVKALGNGFKNAGAKGLEFATALGKGALSLGGKVLTMITTAGAFMKVTLVALGKGLMTFATTTLMPLLVPLAPFIAIGAAIAAVLYSLYEGFQTFRDSLASGDSLIDAIIAGVSQALARLITLPAVAFQGLLEFVTGLLGFDSLSESIGEIDIVGTVFSSIRNILTSAKDFIVDLFTFDEANFPSFGDFGNYAKRALATLARNVLPEPDSFLAKFIPDSIYEFAGINPETGEFLTQQNTEGMDGGVEAAMIQKKKETEDKLSEIEKDEAIVDRVQTDYFRKRDRHAGIRYDRRGNMISGRFTSEKTKQRADQRASIEMQQALQTNVSNLEAKEAELAAQGGQLSDEESRELRVLKQILAQRGGRAFDADKGGLQTFGMDLHDTKKDMSGIFSEKYALQTDLTNIRDMSPDAVRDQDLVTNQFRGMDGIDVSGQTNETQELLKKIANSRSQMDSTAGIVQTQMDAITSLLNPEQIEQMRDKVTKINRILKDGITEEEREELAALGIDTSRNFIQKTFGMDAGLEERARAEAVAIRDEFLKSNADMREIQKQASSTNVIAPSFTDASSSSSKTVMPVNHSPTNPPAGSSGSDFRTMMAFR